MPQLLYPRERAPGTLDRRLGGPQTCKTQGQLYLYLFFALYKRSLNPKIMYSIAR
jgi:hypothetical protein